MPFRRLILPLLVALPVLAVLLGLGAWQWQRLGWKTALLAELATAEAGPPEPLGDPPLPYRKVAVTGRFDHTREALLGAEVRGNRMGAHLLVPLLRPGAPPLLVDRGWVPVPPGPALERPQAEVTVIGYVRPADARDWQSATDDVTGRRFYTFDPAVIGRALEVPGVVPHVGLVALATPGTPDASLPAPARQLPRPNNNHLGYAITWWGLAAALLGVLAVFLRRRLKDAP
jgi:surfeit locus 1 family protein